MRLGLLSDLHWMREPPASAAAWHGGGEFAGVLERLGAALEHFAEEGVNRVVVAGDLVHHGDVDSLLEVLRALDQASAPVSIVAGNHDVAGDEKRLARALELAETPGLTLAAPTGEEREGVYLAGVHVGATDGWFGAGLAAMPPPDAWGPHPLVFICHYPVLSLATELAARCLPYPGDLLDREQLAATLLARSAPSVVLGGHIHARATRTQGSVLQLSAGALVEPPYECAVIDVESVDGSALTVQRSCVRLLGEPRRGEPVLSPEREAWSFEGGRWVVGVPVAPGELAGQG